MEQNLKLTSIEGKELEDATKYRQLVGGLNYLNTTRPDISFAIGILSTFMQKPCEGHWSAAKKVLRYLVGSNIATIMLQLLGLPSLLLSTR